jgi:hypothetical protein
MMNGYFLFVLPACPFRTLLSVKLIFGAIFSAGLDKSVMDQVQYSRKYGLIRRTGS